MTLEEKENQLKLQVNIFNKNFIWWREEVENAQAEMCVAENDNFSKISERRMLQLLKKLQYLAGRACSEAKTLSDLQKRIYKFNLELELAREQEGLEKAKRHKHKR